MSNARELAELGGSYGTGGFVGMKNRIINGAMMIDQRNAGASVTPVSGSYLVDRFFYLASQASKFTFQQNAGSVTPPVGFNKYLGATVASAVSISSSDFFIVQQSIEGLNVPDLSWGTANAAAVTLSFKVYSSLTGTFGGALRNSAGDRNYPFSYTVASANTWTTVSVTIAGDTTGTWLTTNGIGIQVVWGLGVGSTYSGTAGSWSATPYLSATGAVSFVGTSGATFYITGVQLEKGSTATSFDYRPYGTELALCQRYYYRIMGASNYRVCSVGANGTASAGGIVTFPVTMRAAPSFGQSGLSLYNYAPGTISNFSSFYTTTFSPFNAYLVWNGSGFTAGQWVGDVSVGGSATNYADFSAEL